MAAAGRSQQPTHRRDCRVAAFRGRRHDRPVLRLGAALPAVLRGDRLWRHHPACGDGADRIAAGLITVRFDAQVAPGLDWEFRPLKKAISVHPGEQNQVFFRAVNRTAAPITAQAVYNVTPTKAGIYFDKLQCFCFNSQTLAPGQSVDMGVVFFVDPDILTDPEHQRGTLDHAVLYDVSGARGRISDRVRSTSIAASFRKLTDPSPNP